MISPLKLLAIPYIRNHYRIHPLLFVMQLFFNPAGSKNWYLQPDCLRTTCFLVKPSFIFCNLQVKAWFKTRNTNYFAGTVYANQQPRLGYTQVLVGRHQLKCVLQCQPFIITGNNYTGAFTEAKLENNTNKIFFQEPVCFPEKILTHSLRLCLVEILFIVCHVSHSKLSQTAARDLCTRTAQNLYNVIYRQQKQLEYSRIHNVDNFSAANLYF